MVSSITRRTAFATVPRQLLRYGVIGVGSNAAVYLLYLLLTMHGASPRHAITVSYTTGACIGFLANRHWTFAYRGRLFPTVLRYVLAHGAGYVLNLVIVWGFHERLGLPHQYVQGGAVCAVAIFLFVVFRYVVFPTTVPDAAR